MPSQSTQTDVVKMLLRCPECKGKGSVFNRYGPDYECVCRKRARAWLKNNEQAEG